MLQQVMMPVILRKQKHPFIAHYIIYIFYFAPFILPILFLENTGRRDY
jgi:hypothetical protein